MSDCTSFRWRYLRVARVHARASVRQWCLIYFCSFVFFHAHTSNVLLHTCAQHVPWVTTRERTRSDSDRWYFLPISLWNVEVPGNVISSCQMHPVMLAGTSILPRIYRSRSEDTRKSINSVFSLFCIFFPSYIIHNAIPFKSMADVQVQKKTKLDRPAESMYVHSTLLLAYSPNINPVLQSQQDTMGKRESK